MRKKTGCRRNHSVLTATQALAIERRVEEMGIKKSFVADKMGVFPSAFTLMMRGQKNVFEPQRAVIREVLGLDKRTLHEGGESYETMEWRRL